MTVGNVSVDISGLTSALNTKKGEYQAQAETIQGLFDGVNLSVTSANADFADDGIYNGSSSHQLANATITMEQVNQMSFEELSSLLETADDSSDINTQLQNQQKLYADYLAEFQNIQREIAEYEADLETLLEQMNTAKSEKENAEKNLESAQTTKAKAQTDLQNAQVEAEEAQRIYNEALEDEGIELNDNQATAYAQAMSEFLAQECEEGDDDYREFSDFYNEKLGGISHSTSASESAEDAMNNVARLVSSRQLALRTAETNVTTSNSTLTAKNNALSGLQSQYATKNNLYIGKKNALTTVSTNIQNVQTQITQLQTQMANVNFVNQNKEAIENVAYNKNPQIIAARENAGVVYATDANGNKNTNALDLTKMIPAAELEIAKQAGLDLSEVVEKDGKYYPKYIIARGVYDGVFHIYQRSDTIDLSKYESNLKYSKGSSERATDYFAIDIVRIYGNGPCFDVVANGNGYMSKYGDSDVPKNGMKEVYYITEATNSSADYGSIDFGNTFKSYSTCSPLSFDLNGDGVKTSNNVINYDIDGDGQMDKINDSADAVLVFDKDGDGISGEDGSECFGNNTDLDGDGKADGYKDGFEALKALALNAGLINGKDDNVLDKDDLKFLELSYGLKIKTGGYNSEATSLADSGITQINLAQTDETTMKDNFDGMGNQLMTQEGATFIQHGEEKEYADIWHQKKPFLNLTAA